MAQFSHDFEHEHQLGRGSGVLRDRQSERAILAAKKETESEGSPTSHPPSPTPGGREPL